MIFSMKELTKEQIAKAMECETAEELMAFAKAEGYELTKDEAEECLDMMSDVELDGEMLFHVAGGKWGDEREDMEPGKMPEAFLRGEILPKKKPCARECRSERTMAARANGVICGT